MTPRFRLNINLTRFWAVVAWVYFTIAVYGGAHRLIEDIWRLLK